MKRIKIVLTTCLVICVAAFACILGACGGNDDNKDKQRVNEVTVTVLLADNSPAAGVMVNLCAIGDNGLCLPPKATGSDGKITLDSTQITTDEIKIQLASIPEGYIYADADGNEYSMFEGLHIPNTQDSVTITLKAA